MKSRAWIGYVARRYFVAKRKERSIAASVLSVAGLALGTATLIVVIAVMNGFQSGFIRSIMEISSYHARLEPIHGKESELLAAARRDPRVKAAIQFMDMQVLVRSSFGDPESLNLRALSPDALSADDGLFDALGMDATASRELKPGTILVGSELMTSLGLVPGDSVEVVSIGIDAEEGLKPESHVFTLAGAFHSGFYEYDRSWALCSFETAAPLVASENSPILVGVKLKDQNSESSFMASMKKINAGILKEAVSWREYNRVFFGALRVEKTIIMLVICLIPLVVALNIFHSLRRSVFERHEEIGLLRAMGASPRDVQGIFIIEGCFIGLTGALIGLMLGLAISFNVNGIFKAIEVAVNVGLALLQNLLNPLTSSGTAFSIFSPAYFYLSEVPVRVYFPEALFSFLFACLSGGFSAYFASKAVSRFQPQEILRYE
jgi:lipoprotein-releasing system permease protein